MKGLDEKEDNGDLVAFLDTQEGDNPKASVKVEKANVLLVDDSPVNQIVAEEILIVIHSKMK